jgi:signal transduction histidine kinase
VSPEQLSAVGLSAAVALAVGLAGVAVVVSLTRRSLSTAAVAAPVVVVTAVAAGVYASSRAMFLRPEDSTTVLLMLLAAVPIAAGLGGLVARRVIAADRAATAERMRREHEARSESDRRELVAWVSHDLRTPLAGIRAISEAVEDGVAADVPTAMRTVRDSVMRMDDLVNALLALSRLQADDPSLTMSDIDVGDLVSDTVAGLLPLARARDVRLTGSATPGLRATVAATEIHRAVANLVVNGIRHTPSGGEVETTVTAHGNESILVTVRDQCGGIPEGLAARIFETGFRGTEARTPGDGGGAGLGLAIVAGVAKAHGGTVSVANTTDGCRFSLAFPP